MPWVEIKTQKHKIAYEFTCDAWRRTHPDAETQGEMLYPSFFSGKLETYTNPLYRLVWKTRVLVPSLQTAQLQQATYEQLLTPSLSSPLYSLTISATQYLTNYATTRENNIFQRDESISHPRNQILVYLCSTLCELEKQQLHESLIEAYEREFKFIEILLHNAHRVFPTSQVDDGRRGFHAVLMNVQACIKGLQHIIQTQIERKTLKEHIGQLAHFAQALSLDTTRFIAQSFNTTLPQKFNFHHFSESPKASEFAAYYRSGVGQWMLQLIQHQKKLTGSNPWLENKIILTQELIQHENPGIPQAFLNHFALMLLFSELHGIVLELHHLERLLFQLEEATGLAGDYSVAHNQALFQSLHHCMTCWEKLGARSIILINQIVQAQQSEIKKTPSKNPAWVIHHRFSVSIQSSITHNITFQSAHTIGKIRRSSLKLRELGYGEFHNKLQQVISHTAAFVDRLCRFKLLPEGSAAQPDRAMPLPKTPAVYQAHSSSSTGAPPLMIPAVTRPLPARASSPKQAALDANSAALPEILQASSHNNAAQLLKRAIKKNVVVLFEESDFTEKQKHFLAKKCLTLFPDKTPSIHAQQERLNALFDKLQPKSKRKSAPSARFRTKFNAKKQLFSAPRPKSPIQKYVIKIIYLANMINLLNTLIDYCEKKHAACRLIANINSMQEQLNQALNAGKAPSAESLAELHQQHERLKISLLALAHHPWQQESFLKLTQGKKLLYVKNSFGNEQLKGAVMLPFDQALSDAKMLSHAGKNSGPWHAFIQQIQEEIVLPTLFSAASYFALHDTALDHPQQAQLHYDSLLSKTHQLEKGIEAFHSKSPLCHIIQSIEDLFSQLDPHSEQSLFSSLENLRDILFKQEWKVVREAGWGGKSISLLDTTRIVPNHIYSIITCINTALSNQLDAPDAYQRITSIAQMALQNPPGPLGIFSSCRDPLTQAVYQFLAHQHTRFTVDNTPITAIRH